MIKDTDNATYNLNLNIYTLSTKYNKNYHTKYSFLITLRTRSDILQSQALFRKVKK